MTNETGSVFFIKPLSGFECKEVKGSKTLDYDVTSVSYKDSVTFNCTYYNEIPSPADSIFFVTAGGEKTAICHTMFYVQPHKKIWTQRASLTIPNDWFRELYKQDVPFDILIHTGDREYLYKAAPKKWGEHKMIINKVFEIAKYNK